MKTRRKERAKARSQQSRCARRSRMAAVLRSLGLWEALHHPSMSARLREWFLDLHSPQPEVAFADGLADTPDMTRLSRHLPQLLKRVTFPCPQLGGPFSVVDYFALVKPLADCITGTVRSPKYERRIEFFEKGRAAVEAVGSLDTGAWAVGAACRALGFAVLPHDRIDSRVHAISIQGGRSDRGHWRLRFLLDVHAPERTEVEIDGVRRPVTRVPFSCSEGLHWAAWPSSLVPGLGGDTALPVYVQAHALRAVAERLNVGDGGEWLMHQHMCHSLAVPTVTRFDGTDCWVEFRIQDVKVGYLVCRLVGRRVIVRTFLFLTMDGTPEGESLRRRLRLTRADKEYLGLDRLRTFLHSDLAADPELARLFGGCGCDRLFAFADDAGGNATGCGQAGLVRKYVGLAVG